MKLRNLFEAEYNDDDEVDSMLSQYKSYEEQRLQKGDVCPDCAMGTVELRRRQTGGFVLFCPECHSSYRPKLREDPLKVGKQAAPPTTTKPHTCLKTYRERAIQQGPEAEHDWYRRQAAYGKCEACIELATDEKHDELLDQGFLNLDAIKPVEKTIPLGAELIRGKSGVCPESVKEIEKAVSDAFSLFPNDEEMRDKYVSSVMISHFAKCTKCVEEFAKRDPRRHHEPGKFKTGSPAAINPDDSPMLALLKLVRDYDIPIDPDTKIAKVAHKKSLCRFGHTCKASPFKLPAWNYPLPDPLKTGEAEDGDSTFRYNKGFKYNPLAVPGREWPGEKWDTKGVPEWPVSKMVGYEPINQEAADYILSKIYCPVCLHEVGKGDPAFPRCTNKVSHEYGVPKEFCKEHVATGEYISRLMDKLEAGGYEGEDTRIAKQMKEKEDNYVPQAGEYVWKGSTLGNVWIGKVIDVDEEDPNYLIVSWASRGHPERNNLTPVTAKSKKRSYELTTDLKPWYKGHKWWFENPHLA